MQREFALPGTRPRYAPDRTCDIQHYRIALALDVATKSVSGTCSITLSPIVNQLRWLELDAVELEIAAVSVARMRLGHSHDGHQLRIDLGRSVPAGEVLVVDIEYGATPRRGLYFVGPDAEYPDKPVQVWSQGQDEDSRFWFPCFDSPHEKATSEMIATVPAGFFALSNGDLIADQTEGDTRTMHWRFDEPHSCYLITLVAGRLSEIEASTKPVKVAYYVEPGREDDARRTLGRTPEMIELFSRLFRVAYPYNKYAQVFVADFIFGGMENTTATTLTDSVLLDERAAIDCDYQALVAHELAHQWFGDLLTCRDWGEGWLNEGFATYAEYLWREHAEGRDTAALELEDWGEQYFSEDADRYRRTVATNIYDVPIDIFDHHLYEKGGRVLHMLRNTLGDEAFWKSIGHYLGKHRTGSVETRDLARAIEEATGRVLDWFFEQWITKGAGHPELKVDYSWDADKKLAKVTVKQTQKVEGATPLFRLPTRVRIRESGTADRDVDVEIRDEQHAFMFSLPTEPTQVIFDPGRHLLARIETDKPESLWRTQLARASEAIDRVYAARQLARRGGAAAEKALAEALKKDPFWGVRAAAASALGEQRTDAARDHLIEAIATTEHPKARRSVVRALGEFRGDERAAEALSELIERGDDSYFVEAEACFALGRTRSSRAPEVLRRAAERDSFMEVIRQNAYRGLAEARDDSSLSLLVEATRYGRPPYARRAAMVAAATLIKGRRDRDARHAREVIEERLRDRDFRVQYTAIEALATVGDPASIGPLSSLADRDLDGRLRRRSREVVRDLREGRTQASEVTALRDELTRLREDTIKLRERLDAVEASEREPEQKAMSSSRNTHRRTPSTRKKGGGKKTLRSP